jgi:hypothetical protein
VLAGWIGLLVVCLPNLEFVLDPPAELRHFVLGCAPQSVVLPAQFDLEGTLAERRVKDARLQTEVARLGHVELPVCIPVAEQKAKDPASRVEVVHPDYAQSAVRQERMHPVLQEEVELRRLLVLGRLAALRF